MQEVAILASRALTAQRQFTAVADNIANLNTSGYRKVNLDFKEVMSRPQTNAGRTASYVADRSVSVSFMDGPLQNTSNPLDMAINGEGFFAVSVNNVTQYTRRGQFLINGEGVLVTPEGYPVLDNSGAQIQFPQNVKSIMVAADGTVSTEQGQLAQLGVFSFSEKDIKLLQRAGQTNFLPTNGATAQVVEKPTVRQGFVEGSNANAVQEMVKMQEVSKMYQNTLNLLSGLDDLELRTIQKLGKTQ